MKQDKLEQFIRDNRDEFDDESPSPELWNAIEQKIPVQSQVRSINWNSMLRIAAVFLLGAFSWAIVNYFIEQYSETSNRAMTCKTIIVNKNTRQLAKEVKPEKNFIKKDQIDNSLAFQNKPEIKTRPDDMYQNELAEIQAFYASMINEKRSKLLQFSSKQPEIGKDIDNEFTQIDSIYSVMLNDLKDNINNQEVIEAMILNYRARIQVLDMMLQQLTEKYASL